MTSEIVLRQIGKDKSGTPVFGLPKRKSLMVRALLALADGYRQLAIWLLTHFIGAMIWITIMAVLAEIHPWLVVIPFAYGWLKAQDQI